MSAQDHLRADVLGDPTDLVEIDPARCIGLVAMELEHLRHVGDGRSVCQMAAVAEVHGENGVARLQKAVVDDLIHHRAGERLHIGVLGSEELASASTGETFDGVGIGLAPVIAVARIPLRVLVDEDGAHGRKYFGVGIVLGRDEL